MNENKDVKINKPIHQEDGNKSKLLKCFDELDKGKLVIGLAGLFVCGGYFYPTILTTSAITSIGGIATKLGIGGLGVIMGALVTDISFNKGKSILVEENNTVDFEENKNKEEEM